MHSGSVCMYTSAHTHTRTQYAHASTGFVSGTTLICVVMLKDWGCLVHDSRALGQRKHSGLELQLRLAGAAHATSIQASLHGHPHASTPRKTTQHPISGSEMRFGNKMYHCVSMSWVFHHVQISHVARRMRRTPDKKTKTKEKENKNTYPFAWRSPRWPRWRCCTRR